MTIIGKTTAAEAVKLVKNGDCIYVQGSTSIPEKLMEALANRGEELKGVTIYSGFGVSKGESPVCQPKYKDSFLVDSFFVNNSVRKWIN